MQYNYNISRKIFYLSAFFLLMFTPRTLLADITTLPYTETFSTNFIVGNDIDFIPSWFGNEISIDERIYQTHLLLQQ